MTTPDDGKVHFSHPEYSTRLREWIAWTRDDRIFLKDLVGKTVNVGTKDGLVYEGVTVTGIDSRYGYLLVKGGRQGSAYAVVPGREPAPVPEAGVAIDPYEIARGYIHPEATT